MRVEIDTEKNVIQFGDISIIQSELGRNGLDPLNQRSTIGVKALVGKNYYGYWFSTETMRPEHVIYALGQSLMDFARDPVGFALHESYTPEGTIHSPADFDEVSPAWEEGLGEDDEPELLFGDLVELTGEEEGDAVPVAG